MVSTSARQKIVLAGKDLEFLRELNEFLTACDYEVQEFHEGIEASRFISHQKYSCVTLFFTDLKDLEVPTFCNNLLASQMDGSVHLIVVAESFSESQLMAWIKSGADQVLHKASRIGYIHAYIQAGFRKLDYIQSMQSKVMEFKGAVHGRYQLRHKIGQGGVSEIYEGWDSSLGRSVAVKKITVDAFSNVLMGEEMWREARITASLNHPNIVTVHDCWADMSGCYLVMEVLEGISLEDFIDKGPISLLLFENIVKQSLGALVTAHSAGVLHCDLKPSNLMLLGDPTNQPTAVRVKLLDFGVARLIQEIHPEYFQGVKEVLGSPLYIPPEVFTLESLDERSDLYSLGHILYNALAGRPAISATTMDDILDAHERGIFDSLSSIRPDLSHAFCDWVERLIKRQPSHRFQTSKEALEAFITLQFERTQAIERI